MNCASCGRTNRASARFCGGCGASLAPRCPACGAAAEPDARFCDACGASFSPRATEDGVARKVVTILFADLIGSTALHERLDPESVSRLMEGYHRAVRAPVEAHGGSVVQLLGDGVMCAFGVPRVAEDDALRAVRAAVDVQRAFRDFAREQGERVGPLGLRVALNTGEVVVSDDYSAGIGDPLNVAARLQQEARDGDVLIGEATQRLVAEQVTLARVGTFALKGRAEPVTAYRVESLERPAGAAAVPFVGRDDELRRLAVVYEGAVSAPGTRLAVLLGSPGLGKSRLLGEFARRLGESATVLTAACNAGGGATFAPLAEALRTALEAAVLEDDAERARVTGGIEALLAGAPASPEETFFVVRRLLAALATAQPLVLVIDDLHWAEPLLLDLVEHLVQWGAGVPLLVLAAARPELRDTRSSLASAGGVVADVVILGGLDAGSATRLAASVIGADVLPAAVAGRVLATSEGNPLFLGELVRMLVNDGALRREGDRWTTAVELADLAMPPTIQALLAARIERLRPEERLVLERAAVIGRQFSRAAVVHLLPVEAQAELGVRLEALRRSELIESDTGWLLGEPTLRFHHVLIRDAAYRRVLRNTRAELHARFAEWLEARAGESIEHDETIGWHLEQAHQHLRELAPLDAKGRALGESAARYLAAAGRRALARDDLRPAASLLGRALDRLDPADAARAELALDWCEALLAAGEVGPAALAIGELGRFTTGSERLRAWHACFSGELAVLTEPKTLHATSEAVAVAAAALASAGDGAGEAKAHFVHARALAQLGKIGACEAALDRALAAARRVGDRRRSNAVLAGAPLAALWGPSPVTRASGRCLDVVRVLRITQGAPAVEAVALSCQAVLETLRGRADAARRMIASSRRMVEELGITQRVLEADRFAGLIELLEGDAVAAERWLRPAYEGLAAHGLGIDAAQAAALLGRALLAQGRAAEAEALSQESEALAGDSFKAAIAWRGVRAEALSARGEHAAAVDVASKAVEIAVATDDLLDHADARMALAVALRAAGRRAEGDAEEARAIELWDAKGATLLAERARHELGRARAPERPRETRAEPAPSTRRRVHANVATASMDRLMAAVSARDLDAIFASIAPGATTVHHMTGTVFDEPESRRSWELMLGTEGLRRSVELLGTLGDSLALHRGTLSFEGVADGARSFGAGAIDAILLAEVDVRGQRVRTEVFATDCLADALVCLYQRHAELLPDGPERTRGEATARTVAALAGLPDVERLAAVLAPNVQWVDSRNVGAGSILGADALLESIRALIELSSDFAVRIDDVICARPDALLVRWTNSGTLRAGGGSFERDLCHLWLFAADGRLVRWEQFDGDRADEALARFEALTAAPSAERAIRHVRPNAATANAERMYEAVAARSIDAFYATIAEGAVGVHHPTGAEYQERDSRRAYEAMLAAENLRFGDEPLAVLGDSLALRRGHVSFPAAANPVGSFGAANIDSIVLMEVDAHGQRTRTEFFAADRLGDAIARLYERYAELLPDGPERTRAAATARSVAAALGPYDTDRYDAAHAPAIEYVDHRTPGVGSLTGVEAVRQWFGSLLEVAEGVANRYDDILGLRSDALLVRWTNFGTERAGGGSYERHFLWLGVLGTDGLLTRIELFEGDRAREALKRFDELVAETPMAPFANAAVGAQGVLVRSWREGRLAEVIASLSPDFVLDDRRSLTGLRLSGDDFVTNLRVLADVQSSEWRNEPLATRGEQLVLLRVRFSGVSATGAEFLEEHLSVFECDGGGRWLAVVVFDLGAHDAAYAELDERYAKGEGAGDRRAALVQAFGRVFAARDWDGLAALLAPDLLVHDHRLLGWEALHGPAAYVAALRSLVELAPDTQLRIDHVVLSERGILCVPSWVGTHEGGPFEAPSVFVTELDGTGRIRRLDQYDAAQLDAARARLAELPAAPGTPTIENAATRTWEQVDAAWDARSWTRFAALHPPAFRLSDRRKLVQLELDRDGHLERMRAFFAMDSSLHSTVLGTRGNRLALIRIHWQGSDRTVGRSEIEFLAVVELDGAGQQSARVMFDADELDAAYAELDERFTAGEGAGSAGWAEQRAWMESFAHRDWEALASRYPPDLKVHDHRALGWGEVSGAAHIDLLRSLVELAPDVHLRLDHFVGRERGTLTLGVMIGTRDGGAFELPRLIVRELDESGRPRRLDHYDLDQLDQARARFEALRADPLCIPPNSATRCDERMAAALLARDLEAVGAACSPALVFDDRRRLNLLRGDRELFLAANQIMAGARATRTVLATMGDRLALSRLLWLGRDDMPVEVEVLDVTEVDEEGRLVALVAFDPSDRRAASAEMTERYHRGEGARPESPEFLEFIRAMNVHDAVAARAALPDEFAFSDHRRTGLGRLGNADDYVASLSALWAQSDDAILETLYYVAVEEHASLSVARWFGTLAGGGEFDSVFIRLGLFQGGRFAGAETFELEALDLARARFEALRPDPLRIPPNAATRTMDRFGASAEAGDWSALDALCAPECRVDDRRRGTLVSGDRSMFLASARMIASAGSRPSRTLLATSGDQLALERVLWRNSKLGTEIEVLELTEVDREGRIVATLVFDADDQRAASRELFERYLRSDASSWMAARQRELTRALRDRDLARARAALPEDFFYHDHRRTSAGRIDTADGYIAWLGTLFQQSRDGVVENVCYLATESWGELGLGRTYGTLADGGDFESLFVRISLQRRGEFVGAELFELEDLERARARFEELRPDPLRIPPNAASGFDERLMAAVRAHDWDAAGALVAEGATFEDRRRSVLLSGGRELLLTNLQYLGSRGVRPTTSALATAGDRLALQRFRFTGAESAAPFEVETLQVTEVDAEGRLLAAIVFDTGDRRAASRELFERYARSDASGPMPPAALAALRAIRDHDLEQLHAVLPREFFLDDHRRTGLGRIEGAEGYISSLAALFEQAPDLTLETLYRVATERHAELAIVRTSGTLAASGGEFEGIFARIGLYQGGRLVGMEMFEPEDLDLAQARFEELRPDPLHIPPNAATRAAERTAAFLREGNWAALRALTTPDFHFDDRRKLALVSGGVEMYVENLQVVHTYPGLTTRREILCTAGDRVSLSRLSYTGGPEGSPFEGEFLLLLEIDADGKVRAAIHFDPDDRAAAFAEVQARFVAGEAAAIGGQAPIARLTEAFDARDWEALRGCFADDAVVRDHRALSTMGVLTSDELVESRRVLAELAPAAGHELFRILAWNRRGRVSVGRTAGSTRDGGLFETVFVGVYLTDGERIQRYEFFDIADVERALARFEELTAS